MGLNIVKDLQNWEHGENKLVLSTFKILDSKKNTHKNKVFIIFKKIKNTDEGKKFLYGDIG